MVTLVPALSFDLCSFDNLIAPFLIRVLQRRRLRQQPRTEATRLFTRSAATPLSATPTPLFGDGPLPLDGHMATRLHPPYNGIAFFLQRQEAPKTFMQVTEYHEKVKYPQRILAKGASHQSLLRRHGL